MEMDKKLIGLAFGLLMLAGCSTTADSGDVATAAAGERECRPVSGGASSRMRKSVCMSPEEWSVVDAREKAREDTQSEFFRRIGENAAQTQAPAFDSP